MRSFTFATKEEWSAYHDEFVASLPCAVERFHRRADRHGLVADGTVASLGPIGEWFTVEVRKPESTPEVPLPPWWDPAQPWPGSGTRRYGDLTRDQVILIDEVQAYFADVLVRAYPDAKWVIFKGERREDRRGKTLLQFADKKWPVHTIGIVSKAAVWSIEDGLIWPEGGLIAAAEAKLSR